MKLTYDFRSNVGYLTLHESAGTLKAIHISDDLNLDLASDGTVCGIEFLDAKSQLGDGRLLLVNQASGEKLELMLP